MRLLDEENKNIYILENSYSDFVIWRPFCIFGGRFDYAGAEIFALDYYLYYFCQVTCFYGRKSTYFLFGDV